MDKQISCPRCGGNTVRTLIEVNDIGKIFEVRCPADGYRTMVQSIFRPAAVSSGEADEKRRWWND